MLTIEINENLNLVNLTKDENGRKYSKMCSTKDFYDKMYEILAPHHDQHFNYKLPYGVIEFHAGSEFDTFKLFLPREVKPIKFSFDIDAEYKQQIDDFFTLNNIEYICEVNDCYINDDDEEIPEDYLYTVTEAFYPDRFYTINLTKSDNTKYSHADIYNYCNTSVFNGIETGNRFLIPYGNIYSNNSICLGAGHEQIMSLVNSKIENGDYSAISSIPRMIESFINNFDLLQYEYVVDIASKFKENVNCFGDAYNILYEKAYIIALANYSAFLFKQGKVEDAVELLYNSSVAI